MADYTRTLTENLIFSSSVSALRAGPNLGTVPKQVKALVLNGSDDRRGVTMTWQPLETNGYLYHIYVVGAVVYANPASGPTLNIVDGDTLEISVRGGKKQTITFSSTYVTSGAATLSEIVDNINAQLRDASAALTYLTDNILIRPNDKDGKGAKIQILGGTANAELQFPESEFSVNTNTSSSQLLASLPNGSSSYEDKNGAVQDFYYVQAESSTGLIGQRSVIKTLSIYNDEIPTRSVIWGLIVDPSGRPVKNIEVTLRPPQSQVPSVNNRTIATSNFGISSKPVKVLTDEDGYFELEAVVDSVLNLFIPDIKYDFVVRVPSTTTEFTLLPIAQQSLNLNSSLQDSFFFS